MGLIEECCALLCENLLNKKEEGMDMLSKIHEELEDYNHSILGCVDPVYEAIRQYIEYKDGRIYDNPLKSYPFLHQHIVGALQTVMDIAASRVKKPDMPIIHLN